MPQPMLVFGVMICDAEGEVQKVDDDGSCCNAAGAAHALGFLFARPREPWTIDCPAALRLRVLRGDLLTRLLRLGNCQRVGMADQYKLSKHQAAHRVVHSQDTECGAEVSMTSVSLPPTTYQLLPTTTLQNMSSIAKGQPTLTFLAGPSPVSTCLSGLPCSPLPTPVPSLFMQRGIVQTKHG